MGAILVPRNVGRGGGRKRRRLAKTEAAGRDGDEGELRAGISRLRKTDGGGFGVLIPRAAPDRNGR